jgi:hypothetical protein
VNERDKPGGMNTATTPKTEPLTENFGSEESSDSFENK